MLTKTEKRLTHENEDNYRVEKLHWNYPSPSIPFQIRLLSEWYHKKQNKVINCELKYKDTRILFA